MPYRFLNIAEVAEYLRLTRAEVERLVKERDIPFETRGSRAVFRQWDIDAWASQRILRSGSGRLVEHEGGPRGHAPTPAQPGLLLHKLLHPPQVEPALAARTKPSVLRDMAALAARTGWVSDMQELVASLKAREALCSTAAPGGVAFLHPRAQEPYRFAASFVALGRTVQPIHFGAPDGQPTDIFFLLCCQDDQLHLQVLARLCLLVQKTELLAELHAAPDAAAMHESVLSSERGVTKSADRPAAQP